MVMLAMSDVSIERFLPLFANTGVPVAFLVPTPTGYEKSIMDATAPVRELLLNSNVHDYDAQLQGPANKKLVTTYFVGAHGLTESAASLYRPVTKKGDPRIWFSNLKRYCNPKNLLAIVVIDGNSNRKNRQISSQLWITDRQRLRFHRHRESRS